MEKWETVRFGVINPDYIKGYNYLIFQNVDRGFIKEVMKWKQWLIPRVWYDGDGKPTINQIVVPAVNHSMIVLEFYIRPEFKDEFLKKRDAEFEVI